MNILYEYKSKSKSEIRFIESHFSIYFKDEPRIFYSTTDKIIRKLKILSIDNVKLYKNLKNIIDKSTTVDISDMMSCQLSSEISKEMNKCIFSDIIEKFGISRNKYQKIPIYLTFLKNRNKKINYYKKYKKQKKPSIFN